MDKILCIHFANENIQNTSLMGGLICGLRSRRYPDQAGYSKETMFVDSHTQNSKNYTFFGWDASFSSLYEDIHCRWVRWSQIRQYMWSKHMQFISCKNATGFSSGKITTYMIYASISKFFLMVHDLQNVIEYHQHCQVVNLAAAYV